MKKIILISVISLCLIAFNKVSGQVKIKIENEKEVVEDMPAGYKLAYLAKDTTKNMYYLIIEPSDYFDYHSRFKVFSGHLYKKLNEEKIIGNVERYRDGGTTIIDTKLGKFYFPAPCRNNLPTLTTAKTEVKLVLIQ